MKLFRVIGLVLILSLPAMAQDGKALYGIKCAPCHGADGSAYNVVGHLVKAQNLLSDRVRNFTDAQIARRIRRGKGNMPPAKLTTAQIDSLVGYVRTLQAAGK